MKLNKHGWGLVTELVIILICVIMLVYVVYGLNNFGLIRNVDSALGPIKPDFIISGKTVSYSKVEENLITASKNYVNDKYSGVLSEEEIVLRVNHLIKNGYLSTIRDVSNKSCSGYVKARNSETITYTAYIKCDKYETPGYESENDW